MYVQYENSIPVLEQFGKDRAKSIIAQIEGEQPSTSYGSISTNVDLSLLGGQGGGKDGKGPEGKPTMNIMPGDMQEGDHKSQNIFIYAPFCSSPESMDVLTIIPIIFCSSSVTTIGYLVLVAFSIRSCI